MTRRMFNPNYLHPRTKALIFTALFAVAGIIGWYFAEQHSPSTWILLPLLIFYTTLTINTYPSIKLFSSITPMDNIPQRLNDFILMLCYLFLAYSFSNPQSFFLAATFLFIFASFKYTLLLGVIPHSRLLKRKITIDIMGTILCATTLALSLWGYTYQAAWLLAIVFVLANIYWLLINPMYRLSD